MTETLAWPVRIVDGAYATVTVGSTEEQRQNVAVLAATTKGERVAAPAYGRPDPTGYPEYDTAQLQAACERWCPGVPVQITPDPADPDGQLRITVQVPA